MFLLVYSCEHNRTYIFISLETSVLDTDLEIRGGGGGRWSSRPLSKGGGGSLQKIFSGWSKNGGGGDKALRPLPWIRH